MEFSLTTLGSASAHPIVNRYPSAHVVNIHGRLFLIDAGEGVQVQLCRYGFSFAKIDNIFISHLHGDHVFGIFGLLSTMALTGRTAPLHIYAPEGFATILSFFMTQFGEGVKFEITHHPLKMKAPEPIFSTRSAEVYAFPLNHRISTFGFLFKEADPKRNIHKWKIEADNLTLREIALLKEGEDVERESGEILKNEEYTYIPYSARTMAFCSDTAPFPQLTQWLKGVDLLYHEATFGNDLKEMAKVTFHSTARDAALVAKEINAKKLVIGHYSSRYKDINLLLKEAQEVFLGTVLGKEGDKYEI